MQAFAHIQNPEAEKTEKNSVNKSGNPWKNKKSPHITIMQAFAHIQNPEAEKTEKNAINKSGNPFQIWKGKNKKSPHIQNNSHTEIEKQKWHKQIK